MILMSRKLKESQVVAATMLVSGQSGASVAEKLGVTPETVSRWRQQPEFEAFCNQMLNDTATAATNQLRGLVIKALAALEASMEDPDVPPRYRIEAAFRVLALCGLDKVSLRGGAEDPDEVIAGRERAERLQQLCDLL